jgi:hypothetical protein
MLPERQAKIDIIRAFPEEFEAVVWGLTPEQLDTVSIPGEWTVRQIVHHVADSHMNSFIRVKLIMSMDQPPLQGYPQEIWAEMRDVRLPIEASLLILKGLHARWVLVFESLADEDWSRYGNHSENGKMTLDDLLDYYAWHGQNHIDHVKKVLATQGVTV